MSRHSKSPQKDEKHETRRILKKPMGPRTFAFFGEVYSDFYYLDPTMTCGNHKYNFLARASESLNENPVMDHDFQKSEIHVGDFVQISWDQPGEWYARITDVSDEGVRIVNLYLLSQTIVGNLAKKLDDKIVFVLFSESALISCSFKLVQSSQCCCGENSGWIPFSSIIRKVKAAYNTSLEEGHDFYIPYYYCVDSLSAFETVPERFLDPEHGSPFDLCHCPNSRDATTWPIFSRKGVDLHVAQAHNVALARKRRFTVGAFHFVSPRVHKLHNFAPDRSGTKINRTDFIPRSNVAARGSNHVVEILDFRDESINNLDVSPAVLTLRVFGRPSAAEVASTGYVNELVWRETALDLVGWEDISRVSMAECFVEHWNGVSNSMAVRYRGAGLRFFFRNGYTSGSYPPKGLGQGNLRILDMFCGAGNFSKGLVDSGLGEVKYAIDLCPDAVKSFNSLHKGSPAGTQEANCFLRNVARLSRAMTPTAALVDWVVASPPCQDWTIANPLRKAEGRSAIVDLAHIVECIPFVPYLVAENVTEFARSCFWNEEKTNPDGGKVITMFEVSGTSICLIDYA
ncbi:DNA methyltransferase Dim-2 [Entophlyctis sp. JEL0112]|nr:DNA methyltransferase Dim-2 [Entophlyctis sp. JEL0112]